MRTALCVVAVAIACLGTACDGADDKPSAPGPNLLRVGSFSSPTFVTAIRGAPPGEIFVVERGGTVVRLHEGTRTTFADLTNRIRCCRRSQGMLSMAFDPGWETNRRVYLFYSNREGDLVVARFRATSAGTRVIPSSFHVLLRVPHRERSSHYGGQLAFGPDGQLYASTGDGGLNCDELGNGQSMARPLGKILRVDVTTGEWSTLMYGLRNPWRFSFDRRTGDFWLGDVGQRTREEIDYLPASDLDVERPRNGGWNVYEGDVRSTASRCEPDELLEDGPLLAPLAVYGHDAGRCSITGG